MTTFSPREIVSELDRYIIGQKRRQARRGHRLAQPLAPPAARRPDARRGDAEEHPDDRPDRRRQDRDLAPPGQARRRALHQGRGDQVHRGRLCRPRCRADHPRPGRSRHRPGARRRCAKTSRPRPTSMPRSGCSMRWSARRASPATRDSFRKKLRDGELDDKEIEIEVADTGTGGMPAFEIPGMPGSQYRRAQHQRHARQGDGRQAHQDAQDDGEGLLRAADRRRVRQAARPG